MMRSSPADVLRQGKSLRIKNVGKSSVNSNFSIANLFLYFYNSNAESKLLM
jgi:hypothetical protein